MMEMRPYDDQDYETIKSWFEGHDNPKHWSFPEREFLSSTGIMIDGLACGFFYETNSAICFIEALITNPKEDKTKTGLALKQIIDKMMQYARATGFKRVYALFDRKGMARLAGFDFVENHRLLAHKEVA